MTPAPTSNRLSAITRECTAELMAMGIAQIRKEQVYEQQPHCEDEEKALTATSTGTTTGTEEEEDNSDNNSVDSGVSDTTSVILHKFLNDIDSFSLSSSDSSDSSDENTGTSSEEDKSNNDKDKMEEPQEPPHPPPPQVKEEPIMTLKVLENLPSVCNDDSTAPATISKPKSERLQEVTVDVPPELQALPQMAGLAQVSVLPAEAALLAAIRKKLAEEEEASAAKSASKLDPKLQSSANYFLEAYKNPDMAGEFHADTVGGPNAPDFDERSWCDETIRTTDDHTIFGNSSLKPRVVIEGMPDIAPVQAMGSKPSKTPFVPPAALNGAPGEVVNAANGFLDQVTANGILEKLNKDQLIFMIGALMDGSAPPAAAGGNNQEIQVSSVPNAGGEPQAPQHKPTGITNVNSPQEMDLTLDRASKIIETPVPGPGPGEIAPGQFCFVIDYSYQVQLPPWHKDSDIKPPPIERKLRTTSKSPSRVDAPRPIFDEPSVTKATTLVGTSNQYGGDGALDAPSVSTPSVSNNSPPSVSFDVPSRGRTPERPKDVPPPPPAAPEPKKRRGFFSRMIKRGSLFSRVLNKNAPKQKRASTGGIVENTNVNQLKQNASARATKQKRPKGRTVSVGGSVTKGFKIYYKDGKSTSTSHGISDQSSTTHTTATAMSGSPLTPQSRKSVGFEELALQAAAVHKVKRAEQKERKKEWQANRKSANSNSGVTSSNSNPLSRNAFSTFSTGGRDSDGLMNPADIPLSRKAFSTISNGDYDDPSDWLNQRAFSTGILEDDYEYETPNPLSIEC